MARFKNSFLLTGSKSLLKAFAEELQALKYSCGQSQVEESKYILTYTHGSFGFYPTNCLLTESDCHKGEFRLPEHWNEALRLAGEKEEEFKAGDWVACTSPGWQRTEEEMYGVVDNIYQVEKIQNGFLYVGLGETNNGIGGFRRATQAEIESHLIKVAEKKGFVKGAKVWYQISDGLNDKHTIEEFILITQEGYGIGRCGKTNQIFKEKGIHLAIKSRSHIIPLCCCELIPSHPQIEINGYKAEFKDWGLDFNGGCAKIGKEVFIEIANISRKAFTNTNKHINKITIGTGTFTIDQIIEIADHFQGGKP